ncbi:SGNH/GDSL hydrolase family protein [Mycoplasma enhydrae]|uniref:SGNH/GDSL hydrolase family protein n=1 Tax=Mycoplasma enhydrae TaxID=2499220 RepID=UPI0021E94E90|nr:SGNH/GDSL hydrolase family protein [Mycoplasma enhydrae]MCV3753331.1 SGNH/GDSL hydrolase family protein [Mycoplasma enhydrae]
MSEKISIKYVALGDGLVAGFNSKIGFNTNGLMNQDKTINGLGYPSSLAYLIKNNPKYELESFYNLGIITGSTDFLSALFTNDKKALKQNINKIDLLQSLDWYSLNPFKDYFSQLFKEWNISNNDFEIISKRIKEANLITLTAGLYDFLSMLPFYEIKSLHNLTGEIRDEKLKNIKKLISTVKIKVESQLMNLISKIKNINPKAKIVITNYPELLIHLKEAINSFINVTKMNTFDLYHFILASLNEAIKNAAAKYTIDYVDINDQEYWTKNKNYLFENILSLYPTEKGYKKIASDLYTKLFINTKTLKNDLQNYQFSSKYIINEEYWTNNLVTYQPIDNNSNNLELFKEVYGSNKNQKIYIYSDNENKYSTYLDSGINLANFVSLFIRYGKTPISKIAKKVVLDKFSHSFEKYKTVDKIIEFLNNEQRSKEVALTLLKDRKIDNILFILEKELFKKSIVENSPITFSDMKDNLNSILKNNQNLVYDVLKYFFNSGLINESKTEIKEIFEIAIKEALNTSLLSYLFNFKNNKKFQKVREYLSSLDSFKEFIDFLVESIINYSDVYVKLNNFDEFWASFIVKNKYNLVFLFDKMFMELSSESNFEKTIDFIIQTIQTSIRMQHLNAKDYKNFRNAITKIFLILKNNPKYLNNIFLRFLDKIKSISLYNLVFKSKSKTSKRKIKWIKFISLNSFFIIGLKVAKHLITIQLIISKNKL